MEYDIVFLLEAYNMPYRDIMAMPSSRRHRLVKIREEIVRSKRRGGGTMGDGAPVHQTGITAPMRPAMPKGREQAYGM